MIGNREKLFFVISWSLIAAIVLIWLFPLIWIFITSIKPHTAILRPEASFSFTPTFDNYKTAWIDFKLGWSLLNSFAAAGGATAVTLVIGTMAAYSLARFEVKGGKNIALWILSLRMMPAIAIVLPYYEIFRIFGLLDTQIGLGIIYLTITLPFAIWLLYGFIREVPRELDEAALLDGCGYFGILWRFIVPAAAPGIAVTGIFSFLFTWNEFLFGLILTDSVAVTYPVTISKFLQPYRVLWGELSAGGILALIPMVLVLLFFHRYIVRGMTLGVIR